MAAKTKSLPVHGEKIEVKRCPFCGCWPITEPWHGGCLTKTMVSCHSTRCAVGPWVTGETPAVAAANWNRRREA